MKITTIILASVAALLLSSCAASWESPSGNRFSLTVTPTTEQLDSLGGLSK